MENVCNFGNIKANLAKRIRQIRESRHETQKEFMKSLYPEEEKDPKIVSRWEDDRTEKNRPQLEDLIRIAQLGGVSLDWLLTGKEYTPPFKEQKRFTLRDICSAFTQAAFLSEMTIDTGKDEKGRPVILCSIPTYRLKSASRIDETENIPFKVIADFLSAFSTVVSLDSSHNTFTHTSNDPETILDRGGSVGLRVSKLEGLPNTAPAKQLLEGYLKDIPDLTPYAYMYSSIRLWPSVWVPAPYYDFPKLPDSMHEHIELSKKYDDEQ